MSILQETYMKKGSTADDLLKDISYLSKNTHLTPDTETARLLYILEKKEEGLIAKDLDNGNVFLLTGTYKDRSDLILEYRGMRMACDPNIVATLAGKTGVSIKAFSDSEREELYLELNRKMKGINAQILYREDGSAKKAYAVFGKRHMNISQDMILNHFLSYLDTMPSYSIRKYVITPKGTAVFIEFNAIGDCLSDEYGLEEQFIPGICLLMDDTGKSGIISQGTLRNSKYSNCLFIPKTQLLKRHTYRLNVATYAVQSVNRTILSLKALYGAISSMQKAKADGGLEEAILHSCNPYMRKRIKAGLASCLKTEHDTQYNALDEAMGFADKVSYDIPSTNQMLFLESILSAVYAPDMEVA